MSASLPPPPVLRTPFGVPTVPLGVVFVPVPVPPEEDAFVSVPDGVSTDAVGVPHAPDALGAVPTMFTLPSGSTKIADA